MKVQSSITVTAEKLVDIAARVCSRIHVSDEEFEKAVGLGMLNVAKASVYSIANVVTREVNGILYCNLCGKGPFTKKGLFLHLIRLHRNDIKALLEEDLRARIRNLKGT